MSCAVTTCAQADVMKLTSADPVSEGRGTLSNVSFFFVSVVLIRPNPPGGAVRISKKGEGELGGGGRGSRSTPSRSLSVIKGACLGVLRVTGLGTRCVAVLGSTGDPSILYTCVAATHLPPLLSPSLAPSLSLQTAPRTSWTKGSVAECCWHTHGLANTTGESGVRPQRRRHR